MTESSDRRRTFWIIVLLLLPYFLILFVYYVVIPNVPPDHKESNSTGALVLLKVLLMLMLGMYTLVCTYAFQTNWKFGTLIFIGICFSGAADGLSQYKNGISNILLYLFILNGLSHLFYTVAFGFLPLKPIMGILIGLPFVGILMVLIPRIDMMMKYTVIVFMMIDVLMEWRMIVKISRHSGPLNLAIVVTSIGAVCLVLSDALFSYNNFHSKIKFAEEIIPVTYYVGHLGIASSVFNQPFQLRPHNPDLHISGDECYEQLCSGCPFP